ncbi:MAG: 16S rRNA (cytosine(967)-C(5))-methyltransferase [Porticoccaceae bacterium]|nr:16S rRNA (cytosine(967)-C(5))-methyltransferase [Porticoccaceae bacterium]
MKVRVACARILAGVIRGEASLNTLLPEYAAKVSSTERGLLQELCYGTSRWYPALEVLVNQLLVKPLKSRDADIMALLTSGLYQLRAMRTPEHAAVNETVSACQALKKPWAKALANGVLRRYLREREQLEARLAGEAGFQSAHPPWLEQALRSAWGLRATSIMDANNQRPPMTLRVNENKISRADYLATLSRAGLTAKPASCADSGIYLDEPTNVEALPGFDDGLVSVQDEAAQLCASLLTPMAGDRILDACCAPGGKTCHLLEYQPALSSLTALDIDPQRLVRVRENLARLDLEARTLPADAAHPDQWWDGQPFDRILLDAPCSATGVIRRHPDIKLLRRATDIAPLAATQLRLLQALWPTLKPGGRLLYCTCSVLPEENDQVIAAFINTPGFDARPVALDAPWGEATAQGRQLFPETGGTDGFYYALLEKPQTPSPDTDNP